MSLFTQFLRALGEGKVLDAIEAAEKTPSLSTIATAVAETAGALAPVAALVGAPKLARAAGAVAQDASAL